MRFLIISSLIGTAVGQSGCYNQKGDHTCECPTSADDWQAKKDACTAGMWLSSGCGCTVTDPGDPDAPKPECSTDTAHHKHGGYYIEGINGVDGNDRTAPNGQRADKTEWQNGTYYPHGEVKLCTGVYCSESARTEGEVQYLYAHTCAKIRFTYAADSGSTVYEIHNKTLFDACDFTGATLKCAADAGSPCDVHIEANDEHKVYYFASQGTCASGQRVAVSVSDHYTNNYNQCSGMGAGSSRIQHCDCDHHLRPTTLIDPCFSGFVAGCLADMPDDRSCCPGSDAKYENRAYVNGGQCIPKSDLEGFQDVAKVVQEMMTCNQTAVNEHLLLEECPKVSAWSSAREPVCTMVKAVARCDVPGTPPTDCATERNNKLFVEYTNTLPKPTCPEGTNEPPATTDITAVFTLAGTVASLTDADKLAIKKVVAKGAEVKLSSVTMTFADGSVVATAVIAAADASAAAAASSALNSGIMASSDALKTALVAENVNVNVESITPAAQYSPPPPPAAPAASGLSGGALAGIIIGAIAGVLLVVGVAYMMMKPKSKVSVKGGSA